MRLEMMSDGELVARLKLLVEEERGLTAAVLAHMGEVEERKLFLPAACPSMHVYCVRVLGMSEDAAYKRVRAARVVRRFPLVGEALADGRLHVSGVVMLAAHLRDENVRAVVEEASGRTKSEIEVMLARMAPRPERAATIERKPEQASLGGELAPGPTRGERPHVEAVAPDRFELRVTVGARAKEKLERARALLRHAVPGGELEAVLDRALDALLEKVEKRKFGKVKKPQSATKSASRRRVPAAVRRAVAARDGERCGFVGEDGRRCDETGFLELDHIVPVAIGGESTVEGVRVLCRSHNQFEARRLLGEDAVEAGKAARQMEVDVIAGLKGMGVTAADARRAVAESRGPLTTIEERLRAALRVLHTLYAQRAGMRCQEERAQWGAQGERAATRPRASHALRVRCSESGAPAGGGSAKEIPERVHRADRPSDT